MNNPCPIRIDCPGTDFPVTNYSSEGAEPILPYLGVVFPPPVDPPAGSGFWATGCLGQCLSYTSQQEADECAQLQAALCNIGPNDGGGGGGNPITPYYSGEATCQIACENGFFVYFVNAGLFVATTQAEANALAQAYACEKAQENRMCLGDLQRCWCLGDNRTSTIVPSGGVVVAWVVVSGSLPPGLVFNGGAVSGIPTSAGTYSITIRGYTANGSYAQRTYILITLNITQTTLPNGTEGSNYDQQLTVTGGTAPYTFTLIGGGFPLGVDITTAGLITGVVGEVGVFNPVIQVTDVTGCVCSRVFELTTEGGCPTPAAVTFSLPVSPDKTFANTTYLFENMAAIGTSQLMFTFSTDTALRCMDIVDFTGVPTLGVDFLMNAEPGWQMRGAIYDPITGLVAAVVAKPATLDRIAFFDPITGYVTSVELATTTPDDKRWEAVLMRGTSGRLAFYRGSFFAGDSAYIVIVDAINKTITNTFTLASPAPDIRGDGDFCYGCSTNEFYLVGSVALGHIRLYAINATTGVQRAAYDLTVLPIPGYHCAWIDSTQKIALSRPPTFMEIIDPSDGSVDLTRDLDDGTIYDTVGLDNLVKYNFKLNAIMVAITFYELPGSTNPGTGFLLLNPTNLAVLDKEKVYAFFANASPLGMSAENTGDIYLQYNENGSDYPFKQIRPIIS